MVTGRNSRSLERVAKEINDSELKTVLSETSKIEDIAILEKEIVDCDQKLDVLFLNAGIEAFETITQETEDNFDAQFITKFCVSHSMSSTDIRLKKSVGNDLSYKLLYNHLLPIVN